MAPLQLALSLFVEHGREKEAALFYAEAFGAETGECHLLEDGTLFAVDLRFGETVIHVCGSNPARERNPSYGGPFFPKAAGAVSAVFQLTVDGLDATLARAVAGGSVERDGIQQDTLGRRVASVFDPFGHIWALVERGKTEMRAAA